MKRLFGCTVLYAVADRTWSEGKPDQSSLWDSKIELGEKFFNEIINHPVPLNMNTLTALKKSTAPSRSALRFTWRLLYSQFGAHPSKASDNNTVQAGELKKIKIAWPGLNYTTAPGVLILLPSTPAIAAQLTS